MDMKTKNKQPLHLFGLCALCLAVSACSSAPKEVELLEQARFDYDDASANVDVAKHAPEVLDQARDALQQAESRWKNKDEKWRVEHHAYVAKQRVETARLISQRKEGDIAIGELASERHSFKLQQSKAQLSRVRQEALDLKRQSEEQLSKARQENLDLKRQKEEQLSEVRQEALDLKRQMEELKAEQTDRGMVLTLGDVLFDVGKATLAPGAERNIDKIATFLRDYPERSAVIEGHTDSIGDPAFNLTLSEQRAFSVKGALVSAGVDRSRISTQGFGESRPVADNDSQSGRQSNRRVEIIFPESDLRVSEFDGF